MKPQDLGFKRSEWRDPHQWPLIPQIAADPHEVIFVEQPTGAGKTLFALGLIRYMQSTMPEFSGGGVVLTPNKSLQAQLMTESNGMGFLLSGMGDYTCEVGELMHGMPETPPYSGTTVDKAPCRQGYECPVKSSCTYYVDKAVANVHGMVITNYHKWIVDMQSRQVKPRQQIVVCDEAHLLAGILRDIETIEFTTPQLDQIANVLGIPRQSGKSINTFAKNALHAYDALPSWKKEKVLDEIKNHIVSLRKFHNKPTSHYITSFEYGHFKAVPVKTEPIEQTLKHPKKLIIMSATILDAAVMARSLGVVNYGWYQLPYVFKPEHRPILYRPAVKVNKTTIQNGGAQMRLAQALEMLMKDHPDEKGIVHCVSYKLGREVMANMADARKRIILHDVIDDKKTVLEQFRTDTTNKWIISPALSHGEDFPYDVARVQVILKLPYPYLGDAWTMAKHSSDPKWYSYTTAQELWQMCGRVVRSEDDYGVTYIIDSNFGGFVEKNKEFVPSGIEEAIVY